MHQRHRQTDRQQTDGRPIAYSDREREFTFAKNNCLSSDTAHCLFLESAASAALRLLTRKHLRSLLTDLT